jgi:hypothetical protein
MRWSPAPSDYTSHARYFIAAFTLPKGLCWGGCTPHLDTYTASDSSASYDVDLKVVLTASVQSETTAITLSFVNDGSKWLLNDFQVAQ